MSLKDKYKDSDISNTCDSAAVIYVLLAPTQQVSFPSSHCSISVLFQLQPTLITLTAA